MQSDLYSVGAVMVEALTGRQAVPGAIPGDLPAPLREAACRALATNPCDRFPSALAMWEDLRTSLTEPRPWTHVGRAPAGVSGSLAPPTTPPGTSAAAPVFASPAGRPTATEPAPSPDLLVAAPLVMAALVAAIFLFEDERPTVPATSAASRTAALDRAQPGDTERAAIRALAASLADGGLPGDQAMAQSLTSTAAQRPGPNRRASAAQSLSLAQVLVSGGGITVGQFQDVVNVLQPTGVRLTPTTTVATTTAPIPIPIPPQTPSPLGSLFGGHGHGHEGGRGGQG